MIRSQDTRVHLVHLVATVHVVVDEVVLKYEAFVLDAVPERDYLDVIQFLMKEIAQLNRILERERATTSCDGKVFVGDIDDQLIVHPKEKRLFGTANVRGNHFVNIIDIIDNLLRQPDRMIKHVGVAHDAGCFIQPSYPD